MSHLPRVSKLKNPMIRIAIIGASSNRSRFSNKAVRAYRENGDTVFPINPNEGTVEGLKAYPSVLDVPDAIDVASFYVRPSVGMKVLEEVAAAGIHEVLLNPGAESPDLLQKASELGLHATVACSIIAIGRSPSEFSETPQ